MSDSHATTPVLAPEELARCAREAVVIGHRAALRISGLAPAGPSKEGLRLYDAGGVPQLVCRADSAIASAVGRKAWLTVYADLDGRPVAGRSEAVVILAGRICHTRHQVAWGNGVVSLALRLSEVHLELSGGPGPVVSSSVRLGVYLNAKIDPLVDYAVALTQHLNEHHRGELRAGAARLAGLPESEIAEAAVSEVTHRSARLDWIDAIGAHSRPLEYRAPATDPESLDRLLREQLDGH